MNKRSDTVWIFFDFVTKDLLWIVTELENVVSFS